MAGLFFCLASTRCRAFILPGGVSATHKRLQRVLFRPCNYTAHVTKQRTGLYRRFSGYLPRSTAYNTRQTKADITPPVPRWRAYRQALHLNRYKIQPPRRTLYRARQPPIIIRYIRVQQCAPVVNPCQTAHHNADHASPAGSRCFPRPAACNLAPVSSQGAPDWPGTLHPAGQSSGKGAAEPLTATAVSLFGLSPDSQ